MTEAAKTVTARDSLRGSIFSSKNKKGKTKLVKFNGVDIELHQPTVGQLEGLMDGNQASLNIVDILLDYAYVPDTNDKLFEDADRDQLRELPFTPEMADIVTVIEDFMNLEVDEKVKN